MLFIFGNAEARRPGHFPWADAIQTTAVVLMLMAGGVGVLALTTDLFSGRDAPAVQPGRQVEEQAPPIGGDNPLGQNTQPEVAVPSTSAFTEQLDWQFMETEIHSLYKETRPLFMRKFTGWFRAEDGSVRPIEEFKGNSMSAEDRLGASVDGKVFVRSRPDLSTSGVGYWELSIDGAQRWIRIDSLPSGGETNTWGHRLSGALRVGDKIILYGGYDYQHKEAGISATDWYQTEVPAATFEELSR